MSEAVRSRFVWTLHKSNVTLGLDLYVVARISDHSARSCAISKWFAGPGVFYYCVPQVLQPLLVRRAVVKFSDRF